MTATTPDDELRAALAALDPDTIEALLDDDHQEDDDHDD